MTDRHVRDRQPAGRISGAPRAAGDVAARTASAGVRTWITTVRVPAAIVAVALLAAACGAGPTAAPASPGPTATGAAGTPPPGSPTATATAAPSVAAALPAPAGSDADQVLLENAGGTYDAYRGIGRLSGIGSDCTFVLVKSAPDPTPADAPAYVLSNGHCVGIFDSKAVLVDAPADGGAATFDYFVDAPTRQAVPTKRIAWATMRGVDLAVIELDATLADLEARGYRPWPIAGPPATGTPLVIVGAPVGAPIVDIPDAQRFLRAGTCASGESGLRVNEWVWLWDPMTADTCPEILPGNSGSPVLDRTTGSLVGLVNTTTYGSGGGEDCWQGRPCAVTPSGEVVAADTNYAVPLDALAACFDGGGRFVLGGDCTLDDGMDVQLSGTPIVTNPRIPDPMGAPNPSTLQTTVAPAEGSGQTHYRYAYGPLGTTDCTDEAAYGPVRGIAAAPLIDDPLPTTEGRVLLCVVGGPSPTPDAAWQSPTHASFAVVYVDTTAPTQPVDFAVNGSATDGWTVEPIFDTPTYSAFDVKGGPAAATDCDDPAGYAPYRRFPLFVDASEAPYRYCAIGYDYGGNRGPTGEVVLE
jgi:hypothetical protein